MQVFPESLVVWLKAFSHAVRERDFSAGKRLFSEEVTAFGTVGFRMEKLDELSTQQWQVVWPRTTDFDFDYTSLSVVCESGLAMIAAEWSSTGFDAALKPFSRRGRATIILQDSGAGWRAVHTHFSMEPAPLNLHDPSFCHPVASAPAPRVS